ncbi:hypothetical protein [Brevundimonas naejangsanensis]|uniref:hypothetical protein n=1 Tax=Brevundimonas naejangsanensis TaxID=588932 RepID=UPI0026F27379|nr:hypothetical protein [Brevundimonas naejangsanensis]
MKDWMIGVAVAGGIVGIVVVIGLSTTALIGGTTPTEQPKFAVTAADIATGADVMEKAREKRLAVVTAEAERLSRESMEREEAESRRKLDLMTVDAAPAPSGDQRWYVVASKIGRCEYLRASIGVDTPDDVVRMFAANNMPLEVTRRDQDIVMVRQVGNSSDPGMAFVRGYDLCLLSLRMLRASGR